MPLILPEEVLKFMQVFSDRGFEIVVVGGAVRDLILKRPIYNWDFATTAKPEQITELFPDSFLNNNFGTVSIHVNENLFEVTPYREESDYEDKRHPNSVTWTSDLSKDLARRDFTINSVAYDGEKIIDLFGGIKDIENKIIRTVGEPKKRFQEDALRLMRAVRIATELEFTIEEKTSEAIQENASLLAAISKERIRDELFKILSSHKPASGIMMLKNTKLLSYIIPELDQAFEVGQKSPKRHHIYDVGTHLVKSLEACASPDPLLRLATLLHDIGKPATYNKDPETGIITFYNHEVVGSEMVNKIADNLRLSKDQKHKLFQLVRYHQFTVSEIQTDKAIRRFIREVEKENLDDIITLRIADRIGSGSSATSWRTELFKKRIEEVQKEPFKVTDLKIKGDDVMSLLHIPPGPKIGFLLNELFKKVEEKEIPNEKNALMKELENLHLPK